MTKTTPQRNTPQTHNGFHSKSNTKVALQVVSSDYSVPTTSWGFPRELIESTGVFHTHDLANFGIRCRHGVSGWVIPSDVSDANFAIFDTPYKGSKCAQSKGKGQLWYKLLIANPEDLKLHICEGFKDGLAVYEQGLNAVVVGGVAMALWKGRTITDELANLLEEFDPEDLVICFDIDEKYKTNLLVDHYEIRLHKELEKLGWSGIQTLPNWQTNPTLKNCKDLHDIWQVDRGETLGKLLENTLDFTYRPMRGVTNAYNATHTTSGKYVDVELVHQLTKEHKVTTVKSAMGSGKTYSLAKILKSAEYLGFSFTVITPLISLGRKITGDLNKEGVKCVYRDQLKSGDTKTPVICCLESVKPDGKVNFSKRSPQIVIIDELPQVLQNLRVGITLKNNRAVVTETLHRIINEADFTLCLGADITQPDVQMLASIANLPEDKIACCHNNFKRNNFKVYSFNNLKELAPKIASLIHNHQQVFISVDAKKPSSKNSGVNLKDWFKCPNKDTLIIDSDTVKIKGSDAQRIVEKGELHLLSKYLLIVCSPSVNSGFSIPKEIYTPSLVVCIHTGCASPDSLIQSTMRVRDIEVPRAIVFTGFIKYSQLPCNGAITSGNVKDYFATQEKLHQKGTNCKTLKKQARDSGLLDFKNLSLSLKYEDLELSKDIADAVAIENIKAINREKYVLDMLREQGAEVVTKEETKQFLDSAEPIVLEPLKAIRDRNVELEAEAIVAAPDITKEEAETLRELPAITKTQQHSLKKQVIQDYTFRYKNVDKEDSINQQLGLTNGAKLNYQLTKGVGFNLEFEEMRQNKLAGKSNFNPGLMLKEEQNEVISITQKDYVTGNNIGGLAVLIRIGLAEAIDYCKKDEGLKKVYLHGHGISSETPTPVINLLTKARVFKDNLQNLFGLEGSLFKETFDAELKLLTALFDLVGVVFTDKARVRIKDSKTSKIKKRITLHNKVKQRLSKAKTKKFEEAQFAHDSEIIAKYRGTKELARLGREIMTKSTDELLRGTDDGDFIIEASKRLPAEYGLSKFFELVRNKLNHKIPKASELTLVTPENIGWVTTEIEQWRTNKTKVGLDVETYESLIHKELCYQNKNGKWKYDNPYTGKTQDVKPGLDQNNNLVRIISLSDGINTFVLDLSVTDMPAVPIWLKPAWVAIEKLLKTNEVIGHNLKFDTSSMRKYGLIVKHPWDSLIATKLLFLDCGAGRVLPGGYGLKNVSKTFLGTEVDKTLQNSNWGSEDLTDAQLLYAGGDAELPLRIHNIVEDILRDPGKWYLPEFANEYGQHANRQLVGLENKTIYHATEMQFRGVSFDNTQARNNLAAYEAERQRLLKIWDKFEMSCAPEQTEKVIAELNRRYSEFEKHPLMSESVDVTIPILEEELSGTAKGVIDDHPDIPELVFLNAYREKVTVINQLAKALLSAEIHGGVCKTEYGILSGTGRFSCGGKDSLGAPNLQALIKSVNYHHFGYVKTKNDILKFWESGVGVGELTEANTRVPFQLTDANRAYLTEDANTSHGRLAVGFGQDQFGKKAMEDENVDNHSAFAIQALKVMLKHNPDCLDSFPKIKDFVVNVSTQDISDRATTKAFKKMDAKYANKRFRGAAKTLFYSVLNGAQADKMRKVMSGAVGLPLDPGVGQEMFNAYWEMYQGIWAFIQKQLDQVETNPIFFGSIEYNITTLVDGTKLAFAKENGKVALTKFIACQWSRTEATAIKRIIAKVETFPKEWGITLVNTVHDEVSITCDKKHWVEANKALSDEFSEQYQVYLQGFVPSDEPWETKLNAKLLRKMQSRGEITYSLDKNVMEIYGLSSDQETIMVVAPNKVDYAPTGWTDK